MWVTVADVSHLKPQNSHQVSAYDELISPTLFIPRRIFCLDLATKCQIITENRRISFVIAGSPNITLTCTRKDCLCTCAEMSDRIFSTKLFVCVKWTVIESPRYIASGQPYPIATLTNRTVWVSEKYHLYDLWCGKCVTLVTCWRTMFTSSIAGKIGSHLQLLNKCVV